MILPIRFLDVASGFIIDSVLSSDIRLLLNFATL
jgi:hypothetical protein